ncbi:Protein FAR1-RELATED SEQUENCE 6 [Acorus gramineus]|uniref:Protein FAR1-RELATED SEQUENCE 6 n=1 Tax=Acorus gramineus TaxID=55184 RepID=A0AAV9ABT0_ACOGR|nr:Protein FAR1-RELATED SEQUENCE 6 [Acorus gramineus]
MPTDERPNTDEGNQGERLGEVVTSTVEQTKENNVEVANVNEQVVEQHNHALTPPSERHKLRSQRKLCEGRSESDGDEGDEDDMDVNVEGGDVVVVNEKGKLSPRVGVEFESHEDAYNFYKRYASQMGFRVRKYSRRRSQRNGEIIGHSFCCSLEGWRVVSSMDGETRKKYRPETRLGCKAKMSIRKGKRGEWILSQIVEEHNHDLPTPSRRLKGKSQRKIIDGQRKVLDKIVTSRRNERERVNKEVNVANHNEPADEIVAVNKKGEWSDEEKESSRDEIGLQSNDVNKERQNR